MTTRPRRSQSILTAPATSRRDVLRGTAALAAGAAVQGLLPAYARAAAEGVASSPPEYLLGDAGYELVVDESLVSIDGRRTTATTINGTVPGPLLRFREGQNALLRVTNRLKQDTSIHWHGILVPPEMDGVPGISFPGISAGATFEYRFPIRQYGTYWYHSHSGLQEQLGHYGPLVIEPNGGRPYKYDREHFIVLSDWTFENPERILSKLKKQPDYYNFQRRTLGDFFSDVGKQGFFSTVRDRWMWAQMRMNPTDIADLTGAAYTFLMNGLAPSSNWTGLFKPGERVLLHFINASAATFFDVRIPGLPMTVVEASGQHVKPVQTDEIRIAIAETYNVLVEPKAAEAYTVFAETMDRSGYAMGTLATQQGLRGAMPARRSRPTLSMADMGMDHAAHSKAGGGHQGHAGVDQKAAAFPGGHTEHEASDHGAAHEGHERHAKAARPGGPTGGEGHSVHEAHADKAGSAEPVETHAAHTGHEAHVAPEAPPPTQGRSDHAGHEPASPEQAPAADLAKEAVAGAIRTEGLRAPGTLPGSLPHERNSHGAGNAAVPDRVGSRLHEPGIGLGADGWRVLTYTDLRALEKRRDFAAPTREIEMHLTGNMERFMWSIDGIPFDRSQPVRFSYGERIRLTMVNDTMMNHPMHLHGMWMELENGHGDETPRVHTVNVKPAERLSLLITADEPGRWAFHCHVLYHMEVGMFRIVEVAKPTVSRRRRSPQ
jgi:CopA family copper-resistance protein